MAECGVCSHAERSGLEHELSWRTKVPGPVPDWYTASSRWPWITRSWDRWFPQNPNHYTSASESVSSLTQHWAWPLSHCLQTLFLPSENHSLNIDSELNTIIPSSSSPIASPIVPTVDVHQNGSNTWVSCASKWVQLMSVMCIKTGPTHVCHVHQNGSNSWVSCASKRVQLMCVMCIKMDKQLWYLAGLQCLLSN